MHAAVHLPLLRFEAKYLEVHDHDYRANQHNLTVIRHRAARSEAASPEYDPIHYFSTVKFIMSEIPKEKRLELAIEAFHKGQFP